MNSNKRECNNYQGISLLCTTAAKLLPPTGARNCGKFLNQCVFNKDRLTCDKIFSMRLLLENKLEVVKDVHIVYTDSIKAYASIRKMSLLSIMVRFGIPPKMVNLTTMCTARSA